MEPVIFGFLGTIVGAATSILTTIIASKNQIKIQRELDLFRRDEFSRDFQKENLLKLQNSIHELFRYFAQVFDHDVSYLKETGSWRQSMLGEPLNEQLRLTTKQIVILETRIKENDLRESVKKYREGLNSYYNSNSKSEAINMLKEMGEKFDSLNSRLGDSMRNLI